MEFKNFDHWKTIMKNKVTFNSRVNSMDLATLQNQLMLI